MDHLELGMGDRSQRNGCQVGPGAETNQILE
jgi:hypothetical protein